MEEPSEAPLEMGQAEVAAAAVAGLMGAEGGQEAPAHLKSTQRKEIDGSPLIPKTVTQYALLCREHFHYDHVKRGVKTRLKP